MRDAKPRPPTENRLELRSPGMQPFPCCPQFQSESGYNPVLRLCAIAAISSSERQAEKCRTTCAPGRRSTAALAPLQDLAPLQAEFALIREAIDYLRGGWELGFGSLADPEEWLPRLLHVPASVLAGARCFKPLR